VGSSASIKIIIATVSKKPEHKTSNQFLFFNQASAVNTILIHLLQILLMKCEMTY